MAEESQGVQNKWLLVVAAILGIIVAIVYNVDRNRAIRIAEGAKKRVLVYKVDIKANQRVPAKNLTVRTVDAKTIETMNLMTEKDMGAIVNQPIRQDVKQNDYVAWSHVTRSPEENPSYSISNDDDMVRISVPIDSVTSPGRDLRPNDRINLVGLFEVVPGKPSSYWAVANVRVLEAGGIGVKDVGAQAAGKNAPRGSRSYRAVALEVPLGVHLKLVNLTTHLLGSFQVQVRSPGAVYSIDDPNADGDVTFNEELAKLAKVAATGRGGVSGMTPR